MAVTWAVGTRFAALVLLVLPVSLSYTYTHTPQSREKEEQSIVSNGTQGLAICEALWESSCWPVWSLKMHFITLCV